MMSRLTMLTLLLSACGTPPTEADPCDREGKIECSYETIAIEGRDVHWRSPDGVPPDSGWPVALLFQGTSVPAEKFWKARRGQPAGAYWQARTVVDLLDSGFAVVTPEAPLGGHGAWQTNIPPHDANWNDSADRALMDGLFAAIDAGTFGPLDPEAIFAAGISSGGYMSSRIAITYPSKLRAIAIHSASYATCKGAVCTVPDLSPDHPPTLLLHGAADPVVPIHTMRSYAESLGETGVTADTVVNPTGAHGWFESSPGDVLRFFTMEGS